MSSKNVNSFSTIDTINTYSNSSLLGIVSGNLTRLTSGNLVLNQVNANAMKFDGGAYISGYAADGGPWGEGGLLITSPIIGGDTQIDIIQGQGSIKLNNDYFINIDHSDNINLTTSKSSINLRDFEGDIYLNGITTAKTGTFEKIYADNLVYNTGNQTISGVKTFASRPNVNGTGVLLSGDIPYVQTNSYFYVDRTRTDSYVENGNILYPYKTLNGAYEAAKNIASFNNPTYITLLSPISEDLTINKGYINLVGNNTNKNDPIRITGSLVFAATGIGTTATDNNFSIAGLGITATSNNKCILFSGNRPQRLFIQDCWLIAKDNGTCLYSNNTNTISRLQGDILKLSPEGVNTTAIDIVSGISSISFAETSSSANVLAYVRNNSTLNISNSQIETAGEKAFQVENAARLTLLNSVLTNTANPSTGIFLKDVLSTAVIVGSAISVPADTNSYAVNGVASSYLFYKNLYFSIDAFGQSTESKIGNNINKNLINSYDPVVYSIGDQTISGTKTFATGVNINGNVGIGIDSNNNFDLYVRKSPAGVTVNPDASSIAVFEGSGNSHITVLASNAQTAGVVLGSPADNFGSYLSWNHDNSALKLATAKTSGFIQILTNDENEAVRITRSGDVGIGTISPSEKLQVVGNILANNLVYNTGNQTISGVKNFASLLTVNNTGVLLSGQNIFVLQGGTTQSNTSVGDNYIGLAGANIGYSNTSASRRVAILENCVARKASITLQQESVGNAVSNITGSIVNFTQNLTGIISTTIASNNNNNFINFSNSNLNLPFSAGDNVGVLIHSQLVITGLRAMANVYFYN